MADHAQPTGEVRFRFGENWQRFRVAITEPRIAEAEASLCSALRETHLKGKRFLDIGSGSGLFSLAARRLGAVVHSFDYDRDAVACAKALRETHFAGDTNWTVEHGSALDPDYLRSLGRFDIVYSWGVLHHTGAMWKALDYARLPVAPGGKLFIAIYNDQGAKSRAWLRIKHLYNALPVGLRFLVLGPSAVALWGPIMIRDTALFGAPLRMWRSRDRGMSATRDLVDWVGGYPFEVARPEDIFFFYHERGFSLSWLRTAAGRLGCNQFVFEHRSTTGLPQVQPL